MNQQSLTEFERFRTAGRGTLELLEQRKQEAQGLNTNIQTAWPKFNAAIGDGLRLGEVSVLAGPGGNGKTNFCLNLILRMAATGRRAYYMPLEDTSAQIMARVHAIAHCDWSILNSPKNQDDFERQRKQILRHPEHSQICARVDSGYIMRNPKEAQVMGDGKIYAPKLLPDDLLDWVNTQKNPRPELIAIDPSSMINFGEGNEAFWDAQEAFVQNLHAFAKYYHIHIMLLTHIRKRTFRGGKAMPLTVDDIQGSAAFNRHTRYIFLLDYHAEGKTSELKTLGVQSVDHKHTMQIAKANYGPGTGEHIAFRYAKTGPQFIELGTVCR